AAVAHLAPDGVELAFGEDDLVTLPQQPKLLADPLEQRAPEVALGHRDHLIVGVEQFDGDRRIELSDRLRLEFSDGGLGLGLARLVGLALDLGRLALLSRLGVLAQQKPRALGRIEGWTRGIPDVEM